MEARSRQTPFSRTFQHDLKLATLETVRYTKISAKS